MRPLATQFNATPPARHRLSMPVSRCSVRTMRSMTSSHTTWTERARSISRCVSLDSGTRGGPEQPVESAVRHRETREIVEVLLIERERAVLAQVDQRPIDHIHVVGLAVGREAHDLVFA